MNIMKHHVSVTDIKHSDWDTELSELLYWRESQQTLWRLSLGHLCSGKSGGWNYYKNNSIKENVFFKKEFSVSIF